MRILVSTICSASMSKPLSLPTTFLVTPEPAPDRPMADFVLQLERALQAGVRLVQLRAKTLTDDDYLRLAEAALACCRRYDARLLLNAVPERVLDVQADGVHLTSSRLMAYANRPLPAGLLVSAACHDERQVLHAARIGADLMTISPVLPTATHTTATPLGWDRFRALAALTEIPAYALGGMRPELLDEATKAGAQGIAAIRALWEPSSPARVS